MLLKQIIRNKNFQNLIFFNSEEFQIKISEIIDKVICNIKLKCNEVSCERNLRESDITFFNALFIIEECMLEAKWNETMTSNFLDDDIELVIAFYRFQSEFPNNSEIAECQENIAKIAKMSKPEYVKPISFEAMKNQANPNFIKSHNFLHLQPLDFQINVEQLTPDLFNKLASVPKALHLPQQDGIQDVEPDFKNIPKYQSYIKSELKKANRIIAQISRNDRTPN